MKKRWVFAIVAVLAVAVLFTIFGRKQSDLPAYEAVTVERSAVANVVSVTGHVEPVSRVSLSFPTGGRIRSLPVSEGERVEQGTILAMLDNSVLEASVLEQQARVARERALLRDVLAPLQSEARAVKDTTVLSKERARALAEAAAYTAIDRAFVYADDAVHEKADELFAQGQTDDPAFGVEFTYGSAHYTIQSDAETESTLSSMRRNITDILASLETRALHKSGEVSDALTQTEQDLIYIQEFLNILSGVVNRYIPDDLTEQSVYSTYQTAVASARTAVNTARSEITLAHKEYDAAETALLLAVRDLELSVAGAQSEAIQVQEAAITVAEMGVQTALARARESVLTAPLAGVVARIDPVVGESVSPYTPVALLITEGAYEIEAFIPEADIAHVKLGDIARVTFDAFERTDVFVGEVVRIALSETMREGVPTYKTTLVLLDDARALEEAGTLRPGMTADIDITTDVREDVLMIPTRSLVREGIRTYVRIPGDDVFEERPVVTGLRGSEGTVEIVSGLTEGEEIVLFVTG